MKTNKLFALSLGLLTLCSCGYNNAIMFHQNQNSTQVILGTNNFNVVGTVSGTAEVEYILMIGGLDKRRIYENAYSEMINKANLDSGARALANVVTEEHVGGVPPFYYKRTLTVSATVIEFIR